MIWKIRRRRRTTEEIPIIRSRVAIFGGTFDPIHTAHLTVAREALTQFGLSQVQFVVAGNPPHKTGVSTPYKHRMRMVELACEGIPEFVPSRIEESEEISYSITTIEKMMNMLGPEAKLFFLIGSDAFSELRSWYRWGDVIRSVEFIVVTRPGHNIVVPPGATVQRLKTLALPVSSSEIRAKLAAGEATAELPAPVMAYIRENRLYGWNGSAGIPA
ncbi:MAG: nicotinate-nucleotide adenylyltransferase [Bryobacteraceae bacterium]